MVHLRRYLGLLALQLVPSLLVGMNYAPFVYFGVLAVSTVYLGAKRQDIPDVSMTIHGNVHQSSGHVLRLAPHSGCLVIPQ